MELKTFAKFKALLPPLTTEETAHLRASLKKDGCRDPLIVWERGKNDCLIVDGHNRHAICTELGIPFETRMMDFPSEDVVMDWIDANQLARRNLTADQFKLALGRRYNRTKKTKGGTGANQYKQMDQIEPSATAHKLAAEYGVSPATVKRAGKFADEVDADPELGRAVLEKTQISKVKRDKKAKQKAVALKTAQKQITDAQRNDLKSVCDLRVCSCRDLFASGIKPDAVITDPPYPKEFLGVFTELAESCAHANVPLVAVMSGQSYLPDVMQRLCEHLKYRWTLAYMTPGGQSAQLFHCKVNTFWKPILLFGSAGEWIGDVAASKANDNDKRFHDWGQSESGMADVISRLTKPGQLICDPFLGGGTTAIASISLGRRFIGCDIDKKCVENTRMRIEAQLCQK